MGYIECCKHKRLARSYQVVPGNGYKSCIMHILYMCKDCENYVLELHRTRENGKVEVLRRIEREALDIYKKLRQLNWILYEINPGDVISSKFYLNYSEYGAIKKCYSNLSTLKMGLTDNSLGIKEKINAERYIELPQAV